MYILLSIVIGLLFAASGVSYKISSMGKVYPIQSASFLSLAGAIVFAILGRDEWRYLSWQLLFAGMIFGVTNYLGVRLLRLALNWGPLSPAWCASALNFVLVIIYAAVFLGEKLSIWQYGTVFCTIGAVIAAACNTSGGKKAESLKHRLTYGFLLIAILVCLSVLSVGLKYYSVTCEAGTDIPVVARSGNVLMSLTYVFLGLSSALDLTLSRSWRINKYAWIGAGMLSVTTILAFFITILIVAKTPAVTLFVLSNATSILGVGLMSVFFMKEKRTTAWYFTVGFALLAILLNR